MSVVPRDPSTRFVRSLSGEYFKLSEAATMLGVSQVSLRKFIREGTEGLTPSKAVWFGKLKIHLYTREDISRIRGLLNARREVIDSDGPMPKRGRPAKWSVEQRKERQKAYSRAYYYKKKAEQLQNEGKEEEALHMTSKADEIKEWSALLQPAYEEGN
jgi:hypothetical protein